MLITILAACGAMFVNDILGTGWGLAVSARQHKIAGHLDGAADYTKFLLYAGSGSALIHGNGWKGYAGLIPVAVTGDLTTRFSTKYGDRLMEKFAADGFKGLLAWGPRVLSRAWLHRRGDPASSVVAKPKS